MSKKNQGKKDNGVHVIDKTKKKATIRSEEKTTSEIARAALEALPEEDRAAILKEMGFSKKASNGPSPKSLFQDASKRLFAKMPEIKNTLDGCAFPGPFSVTLGVDDKGLFFSNVKRVRTPYGPRSKN
jgi:hypothetical protein